MFDALLENYESFVYPLAYFGTIAAVGFWEVFYPRRDLTVSFLLRWSNAFGLMAVNTLLFRYAFPLLTIPFALLVADQGIGVFNTIETPLWFAIFVSFWVLDFSRWTQHCLLHRVPFLWRLHRAHHVDQDYDFTTALRFHPGDALFTKLIQLLVIVLLGAPVEAVLLSELTAVLSAMFAHANVMIPLRVERVLRLVLVTPDLHRVHHSTAPEETDSNFGGLVPWWDRLFGTYRDQPAAGHQGMTIGLEQFRDRKHLMLHWTLLNPFLSVEKPAEAAPAMIAQKRSRLAAAGANPEGLAPLPRVES